MVTASIPRRTKKRIETTENRLILYGVSWAKYEQLLKAFDEYHLRMTYDRGSLEIMTVGSEHELWSSFFNALLIVLFVELRLPYRGLGTTTFSKKTLERGLEPDQCYWIKHEKKIRKVKHYDADKHPPPDLVLEIDITSSSLDRIAIYETMKVKEVWRWDGKNLEVRVLSKGKYRLQEKSAVIPGLRPADLLPFLQIAFEDSDVEMLLAFRQWVQEQIAASVLKSKKTK